MAVGWADVSDARILLLLVGGRVATVFSTCGASEKRVTAQALQRKSKWQQRGYCCATRCSNRKQNKKHRRHLRGYGVLMILLVVQSTPNLNQPSTSLRKEVYRNGYVLAPSECPTKNLRNLSSNDLASSPNYGQL
jgi:hypothetical protein